MALIKRWYMTYGLLSLTEFQSEVRAIRKVFDNHTGASRLTRRRWTVRGFSTVGA